MAVSFLAVGFRLSAFGLNLPIQPALAGSW
jgi:hypothetical protein